MTKELQASRQLPVDHGLYVIAVFGEPAPATKAGIQVGDVIVSVNEQEISSPDQLGSAIMRAGIGNTVRIDLYRGQQLLRIEVKVGRRTFPMGCELSLPTGITLSEPANGATVSGLVTFEWTWTGELGTDEKYDVKVCKGEGCPLVSGITNTDQKTWDWCPDAGQGVYHWKVEVIDEVSKDPKGAMSGVWEFTWGGGCGDAGGREGTPVP